LKKEHWGDAMSKSLVYWGLMTLLASGLSAGEPWWRSLRVGVLAPGPLNAITDVPGVMVGQVTLIEGEDCRTGSAN